MIKKYSPEEWFLSAPRLYEKRTTKIKEKEDL
jgi:hypothetical protein